MTISTPQWMQGGTFLAKVDRNLFAQLWDEGVMDRTAFKVTQRGAGANLSVDVAAGNCVVTGDDQALQGNYLVQSDATANVTGFTAPGSNSRYDVVGVQINDPDAGGAAGSNATIIRVAGTASASPSIPAFPASFLPLAIVGPIVPATTTITNAMIHDAHTGTGPTGVTGVRLVTGRRCAPGSIEDTINTVAPSGWLLAYGQAISRTTYAALFEHCGTTFGVGDGSTTFNVPDLRGRVTVALDNMGGSDAGRLAAANTLGGTGGEETHTLTTTEMPSHTHTGPSHNHPIDHDHARTDQTFLGSSSDPANTYLLQSGSSYGLQQTNAGPGSATRLEVDIPAYTGISGDGGTGATGSTGSGGAHNNMQPYILVCKIIRT